MIERGVVRVLPRWGIEGFPSAKSVRHSALVVAGYLLLYALLDVASLAFRTDELVSLWYLADAASLALLLVFGIRYAPAIVLTSLFTGFVTYPSPAPALSLLVWSLLFPLPFVAMTGLLQTRLRIEIPPRRLHDVAVLIFGCLSLSLFLATMFALSVLASSASVPEAAVALATLPTMAFRWWIGEAVGLVVITPLLVVAIVPWLKWQIGSRERRAVQRAPVGFRFFAEAAVQVASVAIPLAIVFGPGGVTDLRLLYLCFLPLIWITLRHALRGALWAITLVDTGAIVAARLSGAPTSQIADLQVFMLTLALTGLAMGAVVEDRRASDARRLRKEEEFRTLVEAMPQLVWITRPDGWNLYSNQRWVDYTGLTLEESYGDGWSVPIHPDDRKRAQDAWLRATSSGGTYEVKARLRRADGTYLWWLVRGAPLHDADGEILKWFGTCTDIDGLMRTEIALSESEDRLAVLAERSRTIAWEVDAQGLYTYISPVVKSVLDFEPSEVVGRLHFYDLHPEQGREAFRSAAFEVFAEKGFFDGLRNPAKTKDGRVLWLSTNGVAVLDPSGALLGYRGSDTDITERELAEENRRQDLERIRRALASTVLIVGQVSETRDAYTAGHQRRVAEIAVRIAQEMDLSAEQIEEIRIAALMHDVGKMSVPTEILSKPGAITPLEFELIMAHAESGYRIIESAHMEGAIAEIVHQHHERCDGSGYPRGLKADELLLASKVIMVADVVEAMMSHRPYRPALGLDTALAEIGRGAGTLYDAEVCRACASVFRDGPFDLSPQSGWETAPSPGVER
jgi:PAS domain S-box-containing protein